MEGVFLEQAWRFLGVTVMHALVMFPYIVMPPFFISPLLQAFGRAPARQRLLERPDGGPWRAVWLGICSPPGRSKIFREAQGLFAHGVEPSNVLAYLVSAHALVVYFPLLIVALNGPQPVLGLVLSALLSIALVRAFLRGIPPHEWSSARERLGRSEVPPPVERGPGRSRAALTAFLGDLYSLWWPLLFGVTLGAVIAAWGFTDAFFSIQGDKEVPAQILSAVVGLLAASVSGVPPVGNVYPAAFLWKTEFFTYAGLMAFYLGVLVTPLALPRYAHLFGRELAWKVVSRLTAALLLSALAVTAFWYALDWLLHAVGLAGPIERFIGSTIEPGDVPWFHTLFWPDRG